MGSWPTVTASSAGLAAVLQWSMADGEAHVLAIVLSRVRVKFATRHGV